jgi:malate dehydrogenase (oxaloacetate-decarboxylating)(NADP+)
MPSLNDQQITNILNEDEFAVILEIGTIHDVVSGSQVIKEGASESFFYIIKDGEVKISRKGEHIADYSKGHLLGEMALFNNDVRVADVYAKCDSTLISIETADFWPLVLHNEPAAVKLMVALGKIMTERIQEQDSNLFERLRSDNSSQNHANLEAFAPVKKQLMANWALKYHALGRPGKLAIESTKPAGTAADLSVAYSPGVAEPCLHIHRDPAKAYEYTAKGHLVGVVSNGTAVLGLGDIGALASKPVMEGKAILFKKFADVDAFDIEVNQKDPEKLIELVCALEPTFGGINLEDIKSPECFEIERICQEKMDIPVFHDDQHGTAIISGAGLLNALELTGKQIEEVKVVFSGAGAAGFSCAKYFLSLGVKQENLIMTDINGVVYKGRGDTGYLSELAIQTQHRTLAEALDGADVFMGASIGNLLSPEMLKTMNKDPIVFAMANPTPEIDYPLAIQTREDIIMGTGRSDYPNQINNVAAFPFIFRGALDTRSKGINLAMKLAATRAIAALAKEPLDSEAEKKTGQSFGRKYLIPKPFDRRLYIEVSSAVAKAALETGMARIQLDYDEYRIHLEQQLKIHG